MAGLSSNWKKLQAKIKAESAPPAAAAATATKRKAPDSSVDEKSREAPRKKRKQLPSQDQKFSQSSKPASKPARPKSKPPMGNTQSSKIDPVPPNRGVAPSLAVWAADNDISAESIAEAYGDALARVSVVDFHGRQVYDSFVKPQERVVDWRTHVSGVAPKHMATARTFEEVRAQVVALLKGSIIVGHDVKHDLRVLELDHTWKMIRDTAKFSGFKKYGHGPKPALRVLAKEILGLEIQTGQHSSIEDARVAMLLFRKHKPAFDMEHANRYPDESKPKPRKIKGKKSKRG